MIDRLNAAIEQSDPDGARAILDALLNEERRDPWALHEGLFPVVQRVLNPPFINPHLSKMYAVIREPSPYLQQKDVVALLRLEIEEYTRREKFSGPVRPAEVPPEVEFAEIEAAIANKDAATAAIRMTGFLSVSGAKHLAGKLLLLGSGYLPRSLGHSISCTAFILLEMTRRNDQKSWPALVLLADYFCKGSFGKTPQLKTSNLSVYGEIYLYELQRAVSGLGIVPLHHTITLYAIERSRGFLAPEEYDHMLAAWAEMMGNKKEEMYRPSDLTTTEFPDFDGFFNTFSRHRIEPILAMARGTLPVKHQRQRLGHYLIKSVLQSYNGHYNPHCLTGLGSTLWILETFYDHHDIVCNALIQYLTFFFLEIRA